jgi:hypothetical protein
MAGRGTKFYRKNEARIMKLLGFKPTSNSGAGWIEKADGQSENVIAELKSTDALSISVKYKDIIKLEEQALVCKKLPVFVVQFLHNDDVFLLVRPSILEDISQYIDTGSYTAPEAIIGIEETVVEIKNKVASSKKAKQKFWEDREARYKK